MLAKSFSDEYSNKSWVDTLRKNFPYDKALMQHLDTVEERSKGYETHIQLLQEIRNKLKETKGELYYYNKVGKRASMGGTQVGVEDEEGWLILANGKVETNYIVGSGVEDEDWLRSKGIKIHY
jgi:hypothetical protein